LAFLQGHFDPPALGNLLLEMFIQLSQLGCCLFHLSAGFLSEFISG
jgi:hypothetical protein